MYDWFVAQILETVPSKQFKAKMVISVRSKHSCPGMACHRGTINE